MPAPTGLALADYGSPLGLPQLRQLISRRLGERGIEASPDQIMLADSGTQAIDLLCRFLLEPGDTVLVDDPCYFNFHALLRAHRAKIVGVPYTPSGPDIEAFAQVVADERPRLYITNSAIHNPTGATLSPVTAHRVLKLADQFDLTIIEDDIFADFEYTLGSPPYRLRRARAGYPHRQLLEDPVGLGPLRLRRGETGMDRRPDRPQDRHLLRRRLS